MEHEIRGVWPGNNYVPRRNDFVNSLGIFTQPPLPEIEEAYRRMFLTLRGYRDLCESRGILLAVQLFPQRYQVQPRDWDLAVREYRLEPGHFDLLAPNRKMREFCREQHILLLDPTEAMSRLRPNHWQEPLPAPGGHALEPGGAPGLLCERPGELRGHHPAGVGKSRRGLMFRIDDFGLAIIICND